MTYFFIETLGERDYISKRLDTDLTAQSAVETSISYELMNFGVDFIGKADCSFAELQKRTAVTVQEISERDYAELV